MNNIPAVRLGIVAVSRDCFPVSLSASRRREVAAQIKSRNLNVFEAPTVVENESDMLKALDELKAAGVNALIVYLGNFGPETPETLLAKFFNGPVMFAAAAEENRSGLMERRGDAMCGLLNASYNLGLRGIRAYIPPYPVGTPAEVADMALAFVPVARALIGITGLKIISFGPRPQDFLACNAPIKQLYNLGVEIQENSELDLYASFLDHKDDPRIPEIAANMTRELGQGGKMPEILPRLAQYELTLTDWAEKHKGSKPYVVFANKCWPAFQSMFGCVPCYINSRFASRGMPVSCEVDIYGALSEYLGACITEDAVTILDINNTVPYDIYEASIENKYAYRYDDVFMGFHCGNTPLSKLKRGEMRFQKIMASLLEPDKEPDITRGTLEGDLLPGNITLFRLQSTADAKLTAYAAQGEILNVPTESFGAIGIIAVPEMRRFYRNVLIEGRFPHHSAVAFQHIGQPLFEVFRYLDVGDIAYNRPAGLPYPNENPFA